MIPMGFQREKLNNAYQYDNLCALLNLYKSEDLSQFALAAELQKTLSEDTFIGGGKANISVIVENKANGNSNNTFLFLVVPHKCDSKIKVFCGLQQIQSKNFMLRQNQLYLRPEIQNDNFKEQLTCLPETAARPDNHMNPC